MPYQPLIIPSARRKRLPLAAHRFAIEQLIVFHGFRLSAAHDPTIDGVGGCEGQLALEACIECDLHLPDGLRLVPYQVNRGSGFGSPMMLRALGYVAHFAVEEVAGGRVVFFVRSGDLGLSGEIGRICVPNAGNRLVVAEERLLQLLKARLIAGEPAGGEACLEARGGGGSDGIVYG